MAEYLNKEMFLQSMGLIGDETKYGNRDREHQNRSYSTWMGYEIIGSIEDSVVEEDVVEVVRCKDCRHYVPPDKFDFFGLCTNERICMCNGSELYPKMDDFCSYGERREGE